MKIYQKSGFWRRALSFLIDFSLILVVYICIPPLFDDASAKKILFWLIFSLYNCLCLIYRGQTLGKRITRIRVVSEAYGDLSIKQIITRETVGRLYSSILLNFGYLAVLKRPNRQAWHDTLSRTYVVRLDAHHQMIPSQGDERQTHDLVWYWILACISFIPFILSILVVIYLFFLSPVQIRGNGMEPNYVDQSYYMSSPIGAYSTPPHRGEVVTFYAPNNPKVQYFKRIVGLPGEQFEIRQGHVYIDGELLKESYLSPEVETYTFPGAIIQDNLPITIPTNSYVVLGDNRAHSSDSREFGFLPKEKITSRITYCFWRCQSL